MHDTSMCLISLALCCKAENIVGVIVANWLTGKVVGVERFSDKVKKVSIVIGDVVWEVISCYCPQGGSYQEMKRKSFMN